MKKLSFSIVGLFMVLSVVSCNKKYTCECKKDLYENHHLANTTSEIDVIKSKSQYQAEKACASKSFDERDDEGYGYKTVCDLR